MEKVKVYVGIHGITINNKKYSFVLRFKVIPICYSFFTTMQNQLLSKSTECRMVLNKSFTCFIT